MGACVAVYCALYVAVLRNKGTEMCGVFPVALFLVIRQDVGLLPALAFEPEDWTASAQSGSVRCLEEASPE